MQMNSETAWKIFKESIASLSGGYAPEGRETTLNRDHTQNGGYGYLESTNPFPARRWAGFQGNTSIAPLVMAGTPGIRVPVDFPQNAEYLIKAACRNKGKDTREVVLSERQL